MLRPKIFPTLWKTWVAYGLPHGFMRHDKILPIQPPNLKKTPFQQNRFFQDANTCMYFYQHAATRSHSQPLEWPQVAASGRSKRVAASGRSKRVATSGRKWPPQTVPSEWPQVAASGRSQRVAASGGKWPLQPVPSEWPQVAASGRFLRFQIPPAKQPPCELCWVTLTYSLDPQTILALDPGSFRGKMSPKKSKKTM